MATFQTANETIQLKKEEIRKQMMARRKTLSPGELAMISESICHALFSNFQLAEKKISLFLPIERAFEINTYPILEKALSLDSLVAAPKCNPKTVDLKHIQVDENSQFELSNYGIPEPSKGRVVSAEHIDIVVVPLLAVDRRGYRVGYGKGYYDRFLKKCSPRTQFIGISHFDELIDEIEDVHSKDIRLHAVITPNTIHRFE